jgi:PKHD-type hydroxylase
MFHLIKNVLTPQEIAEIRELSCQVRFVDGKVSNPHNLAKNNLQMDAGQNEAQRASQIAGAAMARNAEFQAFAFPRRFASPMLCRYDQGMNYGAHSDSPTIALPNGPLRSDVSGTLFIADPARYEGGELIIHLGSERIIVKGEPGAMVVYPSTTLHEVAPVLSGQRLVLITFIESVIADQLERELLFSLNEVYALEGLKMEWENRTRLQYVINNLHRKWMN